MATPISSSQKHHLKNENPQSSPLKKQKIIEKNPLNSLSPDLLEHILCFLDFQTLSTLAQLNRPWQKAVYKYTSHNVKSFLYLSIESVDATVSPRLFNALTNTLAQHNLNILHSRICIPKLYEMTRKAIGNISESLPLDRLNALQCETPFIQSFFKTAQICRQLLTHIRLQNHAEISLLVARYLHQEPLLKESISSIRYPTYPEIAKAYLLMVKESVKNTERIVFQHKKTLPQSFPLLSKFSLSTLIGSLPTLIKWSKIYINDSSHSKLESLNLVQMAKTHLPPEISLEIEKALRK